MKKYLIMLAVICLSSLLLMTGCQNQAQDPTPDTPNTPAEPSEGQNPIVTITMASGDVIKAELYPNMAPNTVNNFVYLIENQFYDGLTFHRILPGFVIQGGCPNGNGSGNPGYAIAGEFASNGFTENTLKHTEGILSMARSNHPDSAGSQFFIMDGVSEHLDGNYAAFGKVIEGMEAVKAIVNTPLTDTKDAWGNSAGVPVEAPVMESVTVETFGVNYSAPAPAIFK